MTEPTAAQRMKRRHRKSPGEASFCACSVTPWPCQSYLLAEDVERLKAENKQLGGLWSNAVDSERSLERERDEAVKLLREAEPTLGQHPESNGRGVGRFLAGLSTVTSEPTP